MAAGGERFQCDPPLVRVRRAPGGVVRHAVDEQRDHPAGQTERAQVVGHFRTRPQGQVAEQHLEGEDAERVHVVARVGRVAVALLRARVPETARGAEQRRHAPAVRLEPARLAVRQVSHRGAADAEVGHAKYAVLVAEHVRGLQVAVNDRGGEPVTVADGGGDHEQGLDRLGDALRLRPRLPLADGVGEGAALDVLVHEPRRLAAQVALQKGNDVRVVAGVLHHADEHLLLVRDEPVPGVRVGAELHRPVLGLPLVPREPHRAKPADAELALEQPARQPRHLVAGLDVETNRIGGLNRQLGAEARAIGVALFARHGRVVGHARGGGRDHTVTGPELFRNEPEPALGARDRFTAGHAQGRSERNPARGAGTFVRHGHSGTPASLRSLRTRLCVTSSDFASSDGMKGSYHRKPDLGIRKCSSGEGN
ncbi:hypothetical protein FTUN_0780 [Frigoriglobus tundricola]|uniref:Uncharacterized protein n=1 Tax=Frigoriglobus tundricola TaxID=2774151 RepID=A0A6M5YIA8_9BACT|nr:hypothetical protein FTUN_0780 [Frigoriglobus tundricola]